MAARTSLRSFLHAARQKLSAVQNGDWETSETLSFVIGNESADLDSICSAVLLAYFRTYRDTYRTGTSTSTGTGTSTSTSIDTGIRRAPDLHIPLANLARADLALRPELGALLRRAGLATSDLSTLSDVPCATALPPERTRWLLVDHNALTGPLAARGFSARVSGCVDHHADEGVLAQDADPRVLAAAGSCASLVVHLCRDAWEHAVALAPDPVVDAALACVALAPILIDTACLGSPDRTRHVDVRAAHFAERFLAPAPLGPPYDRVAFFQDVARLKGDLAGLGVRDVLRRDYKQWAEPGVGLGISSIARPLDVVLARLDGPVPFLRELHAWAAERHVDIVAVMTAGTDNGLGTVGFARQLLVWAVTEAGVAGARLFASRNAIVLGLEPWDDGTLDADNDDDGKCWRRCWHQREAAYSRKQLAPMLRAAVKEAAEA